MFKQIITITRFWHNPKITTTLSDESISLAIELKDFMEALVQELEFPVLSKKGFRKKLRGVMPHILEVIKAESKKAV